MHIALYGISAIVLVVLAMLYFDKKRATARKAHDQKWKEFYNSLLAVAKRASSEVPGDSVAHEMVMEAATRQVLPRSNSGPLRIAGLGDYVRRYEQGIGLVHEADAYISQKQASGNTASTMNRELQAPATDVAWKLLYDAILDAYLKVSAKKPGDEELHILVLEACCHLVLPVNYGGPTRVITRADYVEYCNRGMDIVAQINQAVG